MNMEIIPTAQPEAWLDVLNECRQHDFYHLPAYHALAESCGEGEARLFAFRDEGYTLALPLLLRDVGAANGAACANGHKDATSVYGYAGPLVSDENIPEPVLQRFRDALREALLGERVIAVFSRLHPLFPQPACLEGLGDCVSQGKTVSIDLTVPLEVQRAGYRRNHRRDIARIGESGVRCIRDEKLEHLHTFVGVYQEAMSRVHANDGYFFDTAYFTELMSRLPGTMHLFVCILDGKVIAGGVFSALHGIAQAHLAGCLDEAVKIAPLKLLYDSASIWARERGCRILHMGGGIGSRADSLFAFKQGFSALTHEFSTWRWVVDPATYQTLCEHRAWENQTRGLLPASHDFFPAYRAPTVAPSPDVPAAAPSGEKERGIAVFGAGGHGKVVISTLLASGLSVCGIFDEDFRRWGRQVQGLRVTEPKGTSTTPAVMAIGDNAMRMKVAGSWKFDWKTVTHPAACVDPTAKLGLGTVVFAGAVIQPDAVLGRHVIVNTGATIDHDCIVGDFAHIGPGVHLAGMVKVGAGAFLGIGSVALPGVTIGDWSTVGAGAVVTRDVSDGIVVFGVPARAKIV